MLSIPKPYTIHTYIHYTIMVYAYIIPHPYIHREGYEEVQRVILCFWDVIFSAWIHPCIPFMAISKQVVALEEEGDITRNAELITDLLQRRLSSLGFCNLPILATERADVIFHVSRSLSEEEEEEVAAAEGKRKGNAKNHRTEEEEEEEGKGKEVKIVRILAHSSILKKECDYFREILQEEEEDGDGDGDDDDDVASMSSVPGKVNY